MRFPSQEYRSGLPFPSSGYLPEPRIKLMSPALEGEFFTNGPPRLGPQSNDIDPVSNRVLVRDRKGERTHRRRGGVT